MLPRATLRTLILGAVALAEPAGTAQALTCDPPPLTEAGAWFPVTPQPDFHKPAPHPAPDCPFYQAAWQQFLYDTQPDASGVPAFIRFASPENVFAKPGALTTDADGALLTMNEGVNQVTSNGVLVDRDGYPVFYAIHLNPAYADFIRKNVLTRPDAILDPGKSSLTFPPGIAEYKSAWRVLTDPAQYSQYLTAKARVPRLKIVDNRLVADPAATYVATLGLIGLHVVFAIEGHPEMIWSTFEHIDHKGSPDLTPQALVNPELNNKPLLIDPNVEYILFRRGAQPVIEQTPPALADYAARLDAGGERFADADSPFTTPIYRVYPGSNTTRPSEDDEILLLNAGVRAQMFAAVLPDYDRRANYRLVGATWLDRPEQSFVADASFANAPGETTKTGPVAGQDALSSVAMESFTQVEQPGCFSCHDTQAITVSPNTSIAARRLNMSHLFSYYLQSLGE